MTAAANKQHTNLALAYWVILAMALGSCSTPSAQSTGHETPESLRIADLQIVDCLLPGQIRQLGSTSYVTPRTPKRLTAAECRTLGGEYIAYDRADYRTALNVWMEAAQAGDAEAQTNVGEIFERGHNGEPNFEAAATWYRKAADQGNTRAQFNLGTLYEQGNGVEKNKLEALNFYRQAWGLNKDDLIYQSAAKAEVEQLRAQLQSELDAKARQIELLNRQVEQLQRAIDTQPDTAQLQQDLEDLQALVERFEKDRSLTLARYDELPVFREPQPTLQTHGSANSDEIPASRFGNYYALVVGNQDYLHLEDLATPHRDALEVADILKQRYGFAVQTLLDATNVQVMNAVNRLNDVITDQDNLLIYYAGHGSRLQTGDIESGYWLPINAEAPPSDTFWVPNEFVTRHLARLKAKRILVVADSCYAGLLSDAPGYLFMSGQPQKFDSKYLDYKLAKKARLLLSSGADKPVLDNAGAGHSVFAKAFIEVLEANQDILAGPDLYMRLSAKVQEGAMQVGFDQEPEFKAIKGAGHEVGDFFFVPKNRATRVSGL